jgi:hypothetical protein
VSETATSKEDAKLRDLIGFDLWQNLEDVDLEKTKLD